ncbi:MAG: hypothetical protein O3A00_26590, partial [Planctomycetota bacterium]|nr:hypothetical protein [Planctomycetota bacterium]
GLNLAAFDQDDDQAESNGSKPPKPQSPASPDVPQEYDYGTQGATPRLIKAVADIPARIRQPIAIVPLRHAGRQFLLVANRRSGTISVIDRDKRQTVAEHKVAIRIADLCGVPGSDRLLVIDDAARQLLSVQFKGSTLNATTIARLPIAAARVVVTTNGKHAFVSSVWGRSVTAVALAESPATIKTLSMSFPVRELALIENGRKQTLIAADAFGGKLAVINIRTMQVQHVHELPAHNIRGLAVSADGRKLYMTQQLLSRIGRTDFDDVHWGTLMTNGMRVLDVSALHTASPLAGSWLERIGRTGRGTGDPGDVAIDREGRLAVSLSGTGEVSVTGSSFAQRFRVGRQPVALAAIANDLYVANRFDDTITRIDLKLGRLGETISLGPRPKLSAVDRGQLLFFDARLSHDGWMSCSSCHTDGHTTGLLVDTLGDGDFGAPKRIPSLLGTRDTGPWAWNGSAKTLADQVEASVHSTMLGKKLSEAQTSDLVAYLKGLESPTVDDSVGGHANAMQIRLGSELFKQHGCARCHRPEQRFTMPAVADVGLADENGRRRFNPPSLLGVGQRDALFHDGSALSLEDVIRMRHQLDVPLKPPEVKSLIAYLRSL